jgi:spermidine synthase
MAHAEAPGAVRSVLAHRPWIAPSILVCFTFSGATALIYEVTWVRSLTLIFGSTAFAVSTVLTAFMSGLALGSYLFGRFIDRRGSPLVIYALLEMGIGAYALLIPLIFAGLVPLYELVWTQFHPQYYAFSVIRFLLAFLVLMVPTTCMGGTLPVLAKFWAMSHRRLGMGIGLLYAVNTFGAVAGTAAAGFFLIPQLGMSHTIFLASGINVVLGLIVLWLARICRDLPAEEPVAAEAKTPPPSPRLARWALFSFAATGFAALALEVAWTRVLTLILGPSVYAFSIMLATFLVGLAAGSALFAWLIERYSWNGLRTLHLLQALIGLSAFGTLLLFHELPYWFAVLFQRWEAHESTLLVFLLELVMSSLVMFLPTLLMGGLFPAVVRIFSSSPRQATGRVVARIYVWNTVGAILGSFSSGFLLIPAIGMQQTILLIIFVYLALSLVLAALAQTASRSAKALFLLLPVLIAALVWVLAPSWNRLVMTSGMYIYNHLLPDHFTREDFNRLVLEDYEELFYHEGLTSTINVVQATDGVGQLGSSYVPFRYLLTNGKTDATSVGDMPTQLLLGHLPLLLHVQPEDVLLIGLGSGSTAGATLRHPLRALEVVEIEAAVVTASQYFDDVNHRPLEDPRTEVIINDGRNYLLVTPKTYDVILSQPSNPWIAGVSNLFTREYFELGSGKLKSGGLFALWVQMYGMSLENVRSVLKTFQAVFPYVLVFNPDLRGDLLVVGSREQLHIDVSALEQRMAQPEVRADLARVRVESIYDLLSVFRIGTEELASWGEAAQLHTDDNALLEFSAPKDLYRSTRLENSAALSAATAGIAAYLVNLPAPPEEKALFFRRLSQAYAAWGLEREATLSLQETER